MAEELMEEEQTPIQSPKLVRIRRRDDVWPPKYSSVRYLPKTGFSPTVMQEGGQGKKFIWPPPKEGTSPQLNDVNQLPHGQAGQAWNPEANALGNRPPPFAPRTAPQRRCTDDVWPPKGSEYQPISRASLRPVKSVGRFEDYIKCRTGPNVPPTYRTPPGTQHIEVTHVEGEFIHQSKTSSVVTTSSTVKTETRVQAEPVQVAARRVEVQEEEEEEEEEEEVEEEEEEEEEEESEEEEEEEE